MSTERPHRIYDHRLVRLVQETGDASNDRYTRYALGYGTTEAVASKEAQRELARRDWRWKRSKGYNVTKKGSLWPAISRTRSWLGVRCQSISSHIP